MLTSRNFAVALGILSLTALGGASVYALPGVFIGGQPAGVAFSEGSPETFTATIAESETVSREDKLAAMRKKIAGKKNIFAAASPEPDSSPLPEEEEPEENDTEPKGEQRCVTYQTSGIAWSSAGVKIEEVEGARLVYKEGEPTMVGSTSVPTRDTLAQLPLRSAPAATQTCISSDVIGISKNGALMRNSEVLAYSGFGASTLVGYALDGFPIYGGAHSGTVDACGGATVGGQYRYFVSSDQVAIISCYSGSPISL